MTITTVHPGWAARMADLIEKHYQMQVSWSGSHELLSLTIADQASGSAGAGVDSLYQRIIADMRQLFSYNPDNGEGRLLPGTAACCRQAMLRSLFLACGSISEPSLAYHLELTIRNPAAAHMAVQLLERSGIQAGLLARHGYSVIYMNEGQHLADYLLLAGAHHSLLTFESLRVEKEIRNSVNRAVNCDSANSQRIANTAVRQMETIRQMADRLGLGVLPPDLRAAAEVRLAHPDLSLKELGELLQPPLGKSGMNHRLKRLERFAAERLPE